MTSCARDREIKDNLSTTGQNSLNIMRKICHSVKSKVIRVLTRLWLSYFICDNKHIYGKQMPPDLALLLVFFYQTMYNVLYNVEHVCSCIVWNTCSPLQPGTRTLLYSMEHVPFFTTWNTYPPLQPGTRTLLYNQERVPSFTTRTT